MHIGIWHKDYRNAACRTKCQGWTQAIQCLLWSRYYDLYYVYYVYYPYFTMNNGYTYMAETIRGIVDNRGFTTATVQVLYLNFTGVPLLVIHYVNLIDNNGVGHIEYRYSLFDNLSLLHPIGKRYKLPFLNCLAHKMYVNIIF